MSISEKIFLRIYNEELLILHFLLLITLIIVYNRAFVIVIDLNLLVKILKFLTLLRNLYLASLSLSVNNFSKIYYNLSS
jgi:hypothetical protein